MIDYAKSYEFMSMLALFTYWIPACICALVYLFRSASLYKEDLKSCEKDHYRPELTIGLVIWMAICTITPAINLFALVFDCASSAFKWLGRVFDVPLVAKRNTDSSNN